MSTRVELDLTSTDLFRHLSKWPPLTRHIFGDISRDIPPKRQKKWRNFGGIIRPQSPKLRCMLTSWAQRPAVRRDTTPGPRLPAIINTITRTLRCIPRVAIQRRTNTSFMEAPQTSNCGAWQFHETSVELSLFYAPSLPQYASRTVTLSIHGMPPRLYSDTGG